MRKLSLLTLLLSLCVAMTQAQNISGIVKDDQGKNLSGASVALKKLKDSATVKLGVTNSSGQYSFTGINAGQYFVNVSYVGHDIKNSPSFEYSGSGDTKGPDFTLTKLSGNLKEVTVAYRKPVIEVKADKTILNVEGSVNAVGTDALELLRKSPGVLVDKDDNLSLSGKTGVQVYVDGRPTPLSGKDLSDYLKTLQSSSIEAIEIITNPSAKYDAAGNAGIINIRLKKNKSYGTNGTVNAGYAIGTFPKYNGGISLNNRNKFINVYGNYNYTKSDNRMNMWLYRKVLDTLFDGATKMDMANETHAFKVGADMSLNKRSTLGIMVNGNYNDNGFNNYSRTPISYIPTGKVDRILVANNTSDGKRNNTNFNINYRYADTAGRELSMDGDYGVFHNTSDQLQPNTYYQPDGTTIITQRVYNMLAPTDINIYTFKTDYEQPFKKGKLGVGGKVSYVETTNDFSTFNVLNNVKELDKDRSNDFDYKENINALYLNYNRAYKGFMFQVGVRGENTNAKGHSNGFKKDENTGQYVTYDSTFERNYTDLFPSAALTFNKNPMSQWTVSYSRRIDRPAYQNLNPFEFRLDEYTYQKGNTQLTPQYTNSFAVTHVFKYTLTTTLNYSHVKDMFSQIVDVTEKSKSYITNKNLATQDVISLNISYPFQYKWYSVFANLNTFYSKFKADNGPDRKIDLDVFSFNIYAQQTFRFGKGWTGELSGFYTAPSVWQGTFKSIGMGGLDGGISKNVLKDKATIKVVVTDMFKTMKWKGTSDYANQYTRANGNWESRQFKLNFSYRFGSAQVKAARQRKTGLEDENKRANSGGGGLGGGQQ
ncbi:TonB-dependent receptor [Paraflavitalea sp. CAU 1676]|uniref:TonB-dependent receptor n=1 Tax=Paraflavitalea sp. CAU 1676 TaxID=3032598 RepID=UPI0023DA4817|nr:TonB-dependent receptor [Paraflavitalea sp. CAU 1676]MDF2187024.1 TonB-dependent receptor [Paraflavitalea sp. CAU 1676]